MRIKDISDYDSNHDWQSILELSERYSQDPRPAHQPPLKERAASYLDRKDPDQPLSKSELRQLLSKARKMKKSTKKEDRARGTLLEKEVQRAFNMHR
jgi:hypothetical protein